MDIGEGLFWRVPPQERFKGRPDPRARLLKIQSNYDQNWSKSKNIDFETRGLVNGRSTALGVLFFGVLFFVWLPFKIHR